MKNVKKTRIYYAAGGRSTLLIPDYLFEYYQELRDWHVDLQNLLGILLKKFCRNKGRIYSKNNISSRWEYQETGLKLHRADFRPIEDEWIELKILANAHNMSICSFFVMLLRLEMAGLLEEINEFGVVPPNPLIVSLYQTITLYSIPEFTRILHLRL